ncbi:class I SAM-dependent methyltransferase [bacterium]|nr:class I SAM-dependent methyltransferase [bacterium]
MKSKKTRVIEIIKILKKINRYIFSSLLEQYPSLVKREVIGSCQTLLDLGCGTKSPIEKFSDKLHYSVGIDIFEPSLLKNNKLKIYTEYRKMNVLEIGNVYKENSFDCVLASELIEHLTKDDGLRLIAMMEKIAKKKTIIFTPNGYLPQDKYDGNEFQIHRSGWYPSEMEDMGYRVIGIRGWKLLRGKHGMIKWWPREFWRRVSLLTQPVTEKFSKIAFQILCVKDITESEG